MVAVVLIGIGLSTGLWLVGVSTGLILIPISLAMLAALAIVPFPMADRWLGLAIIATFPLLPPLGLPNLPVGAGVIAIATWRIAHADARRPSTKTVVILTSLWATLAIGLLLSYWPPAGIWMRPTVILGLGAVMSGLGVLVWRDADRCRRWLDGIALGVIIVATSALLVFALQYVRSIPSIVDSVAGVVSLLRGESAGVKFDAANNWLIVGDGITLRAVSPLFPSPNNLGGYLGLLLPLIGTRWLTVEDPRWRAVAGAAVLLGLATMFVTFSRSTWVAIGLAGVVGGACIVAWRLWRLPGWPPKARLGRVIGLATIAVVVGVAGVLTAGHQAAEDRITNVMDDVSVTTRVVINGEAITSIGHDPLRGAGIGNWDAAFGEGSSRAYIHNVYLEYATAAGLFGLAWSVLLVLVPLLAAASLVAGSARSPDRLLAAGLLMSMVFAATQFMFDDNLLNPQYAWLHLWLVGGSLGMLDARRQRGATSSLAK